MGKGWRLAVNAARETQVTRFEVIDESGRVYVAMPCRIELSYQDDNKTLKVFVSKESPVQND